jgi:hypothetical protein
LVMSEDATSLIIYAYCEDGSSGIFSIDALPAGFNENEYRHALSRGVSQQEGAPLH